MASVRTPPACYLRDPLFAPHSKPAGGVRTDFNPARPSAERTPARGERPPR